MKRLFILAGLVCLIAMLLPTCAPAPEPEPEAAPEPVFDQAAEEAAIWEWWEQLRTAYNNHDAKAFAALHAENVENWLGTTKGRAALEKSRTEYFERQKDIQGKLHNEIGIVFVTPDVAILKYRLEFTGNVDADGNTLPPYKALVARVLVKRDGKWLCVAPFSRLIEE